MEQRRRPHLCVLAAVALLFPRPFSFAAPELVTQTFRVPAGWMQQGKSGANKTEFEAADPFRPSAKPHPDGPWKSSREILINAGIPLSPAASALFDAATSTLTVSDTPANLKMISFFVEGEMDKQPKTIATSIQVIRMPADKAAAVESMALEKPDHAGLLRELLSAADAQVEPIGTACLESRPGARAVCRSVLEFSTPVGVSEGEKGERSLALMPRATGLQLDICSTLHAGKPMVETELELSCDRGLSAPFSTQEALALSHEPFPGGRTLKAMVSMPAGSTRLVGSWRGGEEMSDKNSRYLVFLASNVIVPHGVARYVSGDLAAMKAPANMKLMESPVSFLHAGSSTDENAQQNGIGGWEHLRPLQQWRNEAVRERFERAGVRFPPGSFVREGAHGQVMACNTPENLERMAGLLSELEGSVLRSHHFRLLVIQASGSLVRDAIAKAADPAAQESGLQALLDLVEKGNARVVAALSTAGRARERCTASSCQEHASVSSLEMGPRGLGKVECERQTLGPTLEITPYLDLDGRAAETHVSLDCSRWVPGPPASIPLDPRRASRLDTDMILINGIPKLLGVWPVPNDGRLRNEGLLEVAFLVYESMLVSSGLSVAAELQRHKPVLDASAKLRSAAARGANPGELYTRVYPIPPDFCSMGGAGAVFDENQPL